MSFLGSARLWWQGYKTRRKMNRVFSRREDPFHYSDADYELKRLQAMDDALGDKRYGRVLEVGCAEGHFSQRLLRRCETLLCLDISEVALARAKKAVPTAQCVCADLLSWETSDRFDLIVLGDVLYYMDKPLVRQQFESVFDRVASWLAPGGRLLLAHAFATDQEQGHRQSFTNRFREKGLAVSAETVVVPDEASNPVRCMVAVLDK